MIGNNNKNENKNVVLSGSFSCLDFSNFCLPHFSYFSSISLNWIDGGRVDSVQDNTGLSPAWCHKLRFSVTAKWPKTIHIPSRRLPASLHSRF